MVQVLRLYGNVSRSLIEFLCPGMRGFSLCRHLFNKLPENPPFHPPAGCKIWQAAHKMQQDAPPTLVNSSTDEPSPIFGMNVSASVDPWMMVPAKKTFLVASILSASFSPFGRSIPDSISDNLGQPLTSPSDGN